MLALRAALASLVSLVAAAQVGCIPASNPYDPDAPRELQARARVHGVVTYGGAAAEATVTLSSGSNINSAETDGEGRYSIELAPGSYAMLVSAEGAADYSRSVVLDPGGDQAIDIALAPSPTLDTTPPARVDGTAPITIVKTEEGFLSSVAMTVTLVVEGATEVALDVTVDGVQSEPAFQAYTQNVTVLLPAQDCMEPDCIVVCATFRDAAGNTLVIDGEDCDSARLDLTPPPAPLIVEESAFFSAPSFTLHLLDAADADAPVRHEVLVDPASPSFVEAITTEESDGTLALAVALAAPPADADPTVAARTNLIRVRALDAAGNQSPESTLTVIVDDKAPPTPGLAPAPAQTSADSVSVNFLTGDDPVSGNAADDDATFHHYRVTTSLLAEGFDTTLRDGILVSLRPNEENTISVVAWDAAGNASEPDSVTVRHDSRPPTAPTIAPLYAEVRGGPVEMGLLGVSRDAYRAGGVDVNPEVGTYQLKDGVGSSFQPILANQRMLANLRPGRDNDVCVRGVDDAGNQGIEDCALIVETSARDVTSNLDQASAFDVFGDFMLFSGPAGMVLRDLRTDEDTLVAPSVGVFRAEFSSHLHASGDPRRALFVYESPDGRFTIADAQLREDPPTVSAWQLFGNAPYVRGSDLVYLLGGRVRHHVIGAPPPTAVPYSETMTFTPDPLAQATDTDVSGPVTVCAGTAPRVSNGIIVWCQLDGDGEPEVRAYLLSDPDGGSTRLNDAPVSAIVRGELLGGVTALAQQPQVADGIVAWSEGAGASSRVHYLQVGGGELDPSARVETTLSVGELRDLSRGAIAAVMPHNAFTSDVGIGSLFSGAFALAVDDTAPQDEPVLDDTRLFFKDTARGELVRGYDVSDLRWVRATSELAFQPATSTRVTAWIEAIGPQLRLVARALPLDDPRHGIVAVDDAPPNQVAFFGPAKADPTFAVGGRRVVYAVGDAAPLSLRVREVNDDGTVTATATQLAVNAAGPFALDPDGDQLVYVDMQNNVRRIDLPDPLPATPTVTTVAMSGVGPIVMIDIDDDVIVVQRGGDAEQPTSPQGVGEVWCADDSGSARIHDASVRMRGPKVARLPDGRTLFGATTDDALNNNGSDAAARTCILDCAAPTPCILGDASSSRGDDSFVEVTRDGHVAYLNDDLGLPQVVLFDVYARRWSFITTSDAPRSGLSAAERRVVWADPSLGGYAVFELTLP
jgi:Carboxypeptidase regulatory-like domain